MSDYPLWCVDNDDADTDERYAGPRASQAEAESDRNATSNGVGLVRRCRRVTVDEVTSVEWLLEQILEDIEDRSSGGDGPVESWRDLEKPVVSLSPELLASFKAWVSDNIVLDHYLCEGDEP